MVKEKLNILGNGLYYFLTEIYIRKTTPFSYQSVDYKAAATIG